MWWPKRQRQRNNRLGNQSQKKQHQRAAFLFSSMVCIRYFCKMKRVATLLFLVPSLAFSQIRMAKLEIKKGEVFEIKDTDILVTDTLIMRDSSSIMLNRKVSDNFIHAAVLIVGKGVRIVGRGENGKRGKDGAKGITYDGPCLDGSFGRGGTGGSHGDNGVNLSLYIKTFELEGPMYIELNGGNGGDGGNGGEGGGGSPGLRVCAGGNGAVGGNGGTGGNGGNGGTLTLNCKSCSALHYWLNERFFPRTFGGFAGVGGNAGQGGRAGLGLDGDSSKDGRNGSRGKPGGNGEDGKPGAVNLNPF